VFDDPHQTSPERKLWQSVLLRLVEDAMYVPEADTIPAERARLREDARIFLTQPSRDLSMVCNMAGLDMQPVIDRMRAMSAGQVVNVHGIDQ